MDKKSFFKNKISKIIDKLKTPKIKEEQIIKKIEILGERYGENAHLDIDFIEYLSNSIKQGTLKLPTIPNVVTKILKLSNDNNAQFSQYASIINSDPSLTLKLLQLANSVAYRGNYEITDNQQAISRIGLHGVKTLILSLTIKSELFSSKISEKIASKLWKKTLLNAIIADKTSKFLDIEDNTIYTLALLHNIGAILSLNSALSFKKFKKNLKYQPEMGFLCKVIDCFENRVTNIILKSWNFDQKYIDAISNQELPKLKGDNDVSKVIYFSNQISKAIFSGELKGFDKRELFLFYDEVLTRSYIDIMPQMVINIINKSLKEFQTFLELTK